MSSEFIVNSLSSTRRIEKKGRKWGAVHDAAWEEALRENLENVGVVSSAPIRLIEEPETMETMREAPEEVELEAGAELEIKTEEEFAQVIKEIKKMADDPEKLVESHLGIFLDPVPPGKLLNSKG
jgi:hypothetical protein